MYAIDNQTKNFGIYIHIPFCRQKCLYCDFASMSMTANKSERIHSAEIYQQYTMALCQEIVLYQELFPDIYIDTIYFGGGTPSIFPAHLIEKILKQLRRSFTINPQAEITLEANPGTVDEEKLNYLRQSGINRLSFGVQAVQDELLKKIGRIHSIKQADYAIEMAKKIGFANISIDLMYGLPNQSLKMLEQSVEWALSKKIQHISIYGLQIEEETPFGKMYEQGNLQLPDELEVEAMYDYLTQVLPKYGYNRYEISNFAKQGYESRHNLAYWQDKPYLGLGAGAHGYYEYKRVENPFDLKLYMTNCAKRVLPYKNEEIVDEKAHIEEFCFLALRTANGIDKEKFMQTFNKNIEDLYRDKIIKLGKDELIINTDSCIALTEKGMKFGNLVFEEFLL